MYSLVAGVYKAYFASPELTVLMIGGPGVGKTTLLERVKVTQFSTSTSTSHSAPTTTKEPCPPSVLGLEESGHDSGTDWSASQEVQTPAPPPQPRRLLWVCPAPQRYATAAVEDDDQDGSDELMEDILLSTTDNKSMSQQQSLVATQPSEASVSTSSNCPHCASTEPLPSDFDLQPGSKMLPLVRIRPTIGMNLGKNLKMTGIVGTGRKRKKQPALVKMQDIGGKFQSLWERYYPEADAVIFVYKVPLTAEQRQQQQQQHNGQNGTANNDNDSDDGIPELSAIEQQHLLEQVRSGVPEDVPLMVFGHLFGASNANGSACPNRGGIDSVHTDCCYSTASLLPHYHNASQALFFGNAVTGQGVRTALEWLIGLAVTQQQLRTRSGVVAEEAANPAAS